MDALIGAEGEVYLDGKVVPGAFAALENHVKHQIMYYARNRDNEKYHIAMIDCNTYEAWHVEGKPIGPQGELIMRFEGVKINGEFIDAFAEALNFCVWADSFV